MHTGLFLVGLIPAEPCSKGLWWEPPWKEVEPLWAAEPMGDGLERGGLGFCTGLGRGERRRTTTDCSGLLRAGLRSRGLSSDTDPLDVEPVP